MTKQQKQIRCISCEGEYPESEICYSDSNEPVCDTCMCEAEPTATIVYNDNTGTYEHEDGTTDRVTEFENPSDFIIKWKRTDGWRGFYEVAESGDWVNIHSDCILAMSEDERELKSFDEKLEDFCNDNSITLAKVFCRTSNVFSSGYDVFVKRKHVKTVKQFVESLTKEYRDPVRFNQTAFTGKDPKNLTKEDRDFSLGASLIMQGATAEEAVKTVKNLSKMQDIITKHSKQKK